MFYDDYREAEWILPLVDYYTTKEKPINILMPIHPRTERQKIIFKWISSFGVNILYPYDLIYGNREKDVFRKITLNSKILQKLLCSPNGKFSNTFKLGNIQRELALKNIYKLFENIGYVYIPEGSINAKTQQNSIVKIVFDAAKYKNRLTVAYPISLYEKLRNVEKHNQNIDLIMTVSSKSRQMCKSANLLAVNLGAQRFKELWLENIQMYFDSVKQSNSILRKVKSGEPRIVLLLLKNRTGLVSGFLTSRQVSEYRKNYLQRLAEMNFFVIVKPHPGSKSHAFQKDLSQVVTLKYEISELPIVYLASICSFSVAELPTNSIFDVLSCKKNVFWPCEYLEDSSCINLAINMIEKGFPEDFFNYSRFGLPSKFNLKYTSPNISKVIDSKVEISDVDSYIESVM